MIRQLEWSRGDTQKGSSNSFCKQNIDNMLVLFTMQITFQNLL